MKSKPIQAEGLKRAKSSVEAAYHKLIMDAAAPYLGLIEKFSEKAKVLIPQEVSGPYRDFWEQQVRAIVLSPYLIEPFQERCKQVENEIRDASKGETAKRLRKVEKFMTEMGPLKLLKDMWPDLIDLRYQYFTESALKILRLASLHKRVGNVFQGSLILTTAFQYAMDMDDLNFFMRVGDVLRERQDDLNSVLPHNKLDPLQNFLLEHWADKIDGMEPLCSLSLEDLTELCVKRFGRPQLTGDALDKIRQRLGLRFPRSKSF